MTTIRWVKSALVPLVGVLALGPASTATAQEAEQGAPVESARPAKRQGIEEITITARKREEGLQKTPISVTAFGAEELKDIQAQRIDDIQFAVPNLQLSQGYEGGFARVRIRGIGTADPIVTRDPSVGVYLDGVYISRLYGALLSVADINRIEVLRGPQGTLFGKNTTGGAVNVITTKPNEEFGGSAELRYGNYADFETRASLNVPLTPESAFMRVSFASQTRDALSENRGPLLGIKPNQGGRAPTYQDGDDRKLLAGRVALRLLPGEDWEINLTGDQSRMYQNARGAHCRYDPYGETGSGMTKGGMPTTSLTTGQYTFLEPFFGFVPVDGGMNRFADYKQNCDFTSQLDAHDFMSNVRLRTRVDTWGAAATVTWNATEDITAKYTGGWRSYVRTQESDYDWTATAEFGHCIVDDEEHNQWSHELNVSGAALRSRLNWTGGLYAFREKVDPHKGFLCRVGQTLTDAWWDNGFSMVVPDEHLNDPVPFAGGAVTYAGLGCVSGVVCQMFPAPFGLAAGVLPEGINRNFFGFIESNWTVNNSYAGYFQASYDLTEKLSVTAGMRRLVERRYWKHHQQTPGELGWADAFSNVIVNADERFDHWTVLTNVQYQWTDDVMTYATYSTGYKSGGFNGRVNEVLPQTLEAFQPETVDSYEVGVKGSLFDRRLIANASFFYTDYENIQQTVLASASDGSFASVVENAGKATIRGGELELKARPFPRVDLSAGLGWTDFDYKENLSFNNDGELENNRGRKPYNTPQFTMNLSAAYTLDTPFGEVTPRVSWYHQSVVNYSEEVAWLTEQDTFGLLSARVGLELNDGKTEVALWGTNLLDRVYSDNAISFDDGFAVADIFYGPPRLYGIEIIRHF